MRKPLLPLVFAVALTCSGCQAVGLAPMMAEAVNEAAHQPRHSAEQFPDAAAEACRGRAARHGRVEITRVEPNDRNSMRVYGTIDAMGGAGRSFSCVFRNDGNMPYFKLG